MSLSKDKISDKWMSFFVYPLLAFLAVHVGNENSFGELIRIPSYYTDLLLALFCSFSLGLYIRKLVHWMELKFSWAEEPLRRLITQLLLGVFLPSVVILGMEVIYLSVLDIKLEDSSIFYLELPVILILCLIINLIYIIIYQNSNAEELQKTHTIENDKEEYKRNFVV